MIDLSGSNQVERVESGRVKARSNVVTKMRFAQLTCTSTAPTLGYRMRVLFRVVCLLIAALMLQVESSEADLPWAARDIPPAEQNDPDHESTLDPVDDSAPSETESGDSKAALTGELLATLGLSAPKAQRPRQVRRTGYGRAGVSELYRPPRSPSLG